MYKKIIISILFCFLLGSSCAFVVYNTYKKESLENKPRETKIYFIQLGAFKNYKNVDKITKTLSSYLVVEENGLYKVYVSMTASKKNLEKLKEFFIQSNNNIYVKEKKINNNSFITKLNKYDSLLKETNDYETIKMINKEVLNKYKEEVL